MTHAFETRYQDYTPIFVEPREPVPLSVCRNCGEPITRYYDVGLYRDWFHIDTGVVACPHTNAAPVDDAERPRP